MDRTVIQVGNSLGVTLPKEILEDLNVKQGDKINISRNENGKYELSKKESIKVSADLDIDQEFMDGFESLIENYDNTLRALSK